MHSRSVFIFCTIAVFLLMISSSVTVAEEQHQARKLANAQWLNNPHFQALAKRGRFVFRDAPNAYHHEMKSDDLEFNDDHPEKRNWRL
ncbi:hypothetical protein I4U23_003349 [Adineta vaga]|nr:hypothetical protein I4U23_003349 [Adineta vaga]